MARTLSEFEVPVFKTRPHLICEHPFQFLARISTSNIANGITHTFNNCLEWRLNAAWLVIFQTSTFILLIWALRLFGWVDRLRSQATKLVHFFGKVDLLSSSSCSNRLVYYYPQTICWCILNLPRSCVIRLSNSFVASASHLSLFSKAYCLLKSFVQVETLLRRKPCCRGSLAQRLCFFLSA